MSSHNSDRDARLCWAVRITYRRKGKPDGLPFLAGRFYFDQRPKGPCRIALFETRREANAAAKTKRGPWWSGSDGRTVATPVRVRVVVQEI